MLILARAYLSKINYSITRTGRIKKHDEARCATVGLGLDIDGLRHLHALCARLLMDEAVEFVHCSHDCAFTHVVCFQPRDQCALWQVPPGARFMHDFLPEEWVEDDVDNNRLYAAGLEIHRDGFRPLIQDRLEQYWEVSRMHWGVLEHLHAVYISVKAG